MDVLIKNRGGGGGKLDQLVFPLLNLGRTRNWNQSSGVRKRVVSKKVGGLGNFWQMFPCTEISSKRSFPAVLPWQKKAIIFDIPGPSRSAKTETRVDSPKPPFYTTALLFPLEKWFESLQSQSTIKLCYKSLAIWALLECFWNSGTFKFWQTVCVFIIDLWQQIGSTWCVKGGSMRDFLAKATFCSRFPKTHDHTEVWTHPPPFLSHHHKRSEPLSAESLLSTANKIVTFFHLKAFHACNRKHEKLCWLSVGKLFPEVVLWLLLLLLSSSSSVGQSAHRSSVPLKPLI